MGAKVSEEPEEVRQANWHKPTLIQEFKFTLDLFFLYSEVFVLFIYNDLLL